MATPSSMEMPDWQTAAGKKLSFEVATVKPNRSDDSPEVNFTLGFGDRYADTGGRFLTKNISLLDYIRFAYKLTDGQVEILESNAPKWIGTERFDIQAKSDLPNPTKNQMRLMVQSLLADRFKLRVHTETRELPVLALVLVKPGALGPKLHPHPAADDKCSNVAPVGQESGNGSTPEVPAVCGGLVSVGVPGAASRVRLGGRGVPLALLGAHLGEMGGFGRPIVDQTGLTGTFDLVVEWGADSAVEPRDENNRETYLQESLKDQLGLKLERRKASLAVLLVDSMDQQPADN
ncbi:CHP03435 domain-containing protein [Granulicella sibirica]|uniref:CHP03435 domain-containing protein n=2 Tax=Granulicella sibirica TaxID=2479048 RepID=A0A4Q0T6S2_9BACT|nr:CHP03435 domain-containing protein [Granulicella sibirica]